MPSSSFQAVTPRQTPSLHDEIERKVLNEEIDAVAERLAIHRVQHGVTGAVCRGASALDRGFAEILCHAAEGTLIDLAFLGARERHAPMLKLIHSSRRVARQIFDRVLIAQPVRPLYGVEHVPLPLVLAHIAERGRDAALRRDCVRAGRENFGDAGGFQASLRRAERRAKA